MLFDVIGYYLYLISRNNNYKITMKCIFFYYSYFLITLDIVRSEVLKHLFYGVYIKY